MQRRKIILLVIMVCVLGFLAKLLTEDTSKKKKGPSGPPVKVVKRQLLVDFDRDGNYQPYFIKGVVYRPYPVGRYPEDLGYKEKTEEQPHNIYDDEKILRRDFEYLRDMGCNTIWIPKANSTFIRQRNLNPNFMTKKTLDLAQEYGLKVIAGYEVESEFPKCTKKGLAFTKRTNFLINNNGNRIKRRLLEMIKKFRTHPAILFWAIGDGNNAHLDALNFEQVEAYFQSMDMVAQAAHKFERKFYHPVAVVLDDINMLGEITYETLEPNFSHIDIWGVNAFRGKSFGNLFQDYAERSTRPLWIASFGLDAWNSGDYVSPISGSEDEETQAEWIGNLWDEIAANAKITIGGSVREYSDQWWDPPIPINRRRKNWHADTHDYYGLGPRDTNCDGYFDWFPKSPDRFVHLEWMGLMAIEDNELELDTLIPRKAYYTLEEKWTGESP